MHVCVRVCVTVCICLCAWLCPNTTLIKISICAVVTLTAHWCIVQVQNGDNWGSCFLYLRLNYIHYSNMQRYYFFHQNYFNKCFKYICTLSNLNAPIFLESVVASIYSVSIKTVLSTSFTLRIQWVPAGTSFNHDLTTITQVCEKEIFFTQCMYWTTHYVWCLTCVRQGRAVYSSLHCTLVLR